MWSRRSARSSSGTGASSTCSAPSHMTHVAWLEALSPWPRDGFGLDRMRALLAALGEPQAGLPAVHVVGTNGKSTTTRKVEELLGATGLRVGAYLSPHVRSWAERIRLDGAEADLEAALGAVRPAAERLERHSSRRSLRRRLSPFARLGSRPRRSRPGSAAGTTRRTCSTGRGSSSS